MAREPAADVLDQAAQWLMLMHSGTATDADLLALERWRAEHPDHERAWQRGQQFLQQVRGIPSAIGRRALQAAPSASRRRAMRNVALLIAASPVAWLAVERTPWRAWSADLRTGTGEQRTVTLDDGTLLVLNTMSSVDVRFDEQRRVLHLRAGEILVATGSDPAARPFSVMTQQGAVLAIGTRFTVRRHDDRSDVAVYEGAVELHPVESSGTLRLDSGQRATFTRESIGAPAIARSTATLWVQGMLVVEDIRLEELVAELDRYRPGRLSCDAAVSDLRISGAFPLMDVPRSLKLIQDVLPVRVQSPIPYWATIEPRSTPAT